MPLQVAGKFAVVSLVLLLSLYPYPAQLVRQVARWAAFDGLVDGRFPGATEANAAIDAMLGDDRSTGGEMEAVQRYVHRRIPYDYDWDNWGAFDYWPTPQEAWERGREDCDGQAIVAASILRSRGHASATIVGNLQHMWVKVDGFELMGPQAERALERRADGSVRVALPRLGLAFQGLAFVLDEFPTVRLLAPMLALFLVAYHPRRKWREIVVLLLSFAAGFVLLKHWASGANAAGSEAGAFRPTLLAGFALVGASWGMGPVLRWRERLIHHGGK